MSLISAIGAFLVAAGAAAKRTTDNALRAELAIRTKERDEAHAYVEAVNRQRVQLIRERDEALAHVFMLQSAIANPPQQRAAQQLQAQQAQQYIGLGSQLVEMCNCVPARHDMLIGGSRAIYWGD